MASLLLQTLVSATDGARLVIFINGDFTLRENGSQGRMAEQVAFASESVESVAVYSHRQHPSHPWSDAGIRRFAEQFPTVELIIENVPRYLRWVTRAKNLALALWPAAARRILYLTIPGAPVRYATMRIDPKIVFWLNFVDGCTILNGLPRRFVVETHDVRFIKAAKKSRLASYSLRVIGKMRSELAMLELASGAIMISPVDDIVLRSLIPNLNSFYVPTYATGITSAAIETDHQFDLLFVGANNNFNLLGVIDFITSHAGFLSGRTLAIAGRVCESLELRAHIEGLPHITLLGFVDDLAPVYAASRLVISPVDGTGLKIKVVEALAHGKVVVGSRHSQDSLPPGYELCVLAIDDDQMNALLDHPEQLAAAEEAGRAYYKLFTEVGDRKALVRYFEQQFAA